MRSALLLLASTLAFANYPNQTSLLLDANKNTVSVTDLGSVGTTETITFDAPASGHRLRVTFTPINVPPKIRDTYTACPDPCSSSFFRNWGVQYRKSKEGVATTATQTTVGSTTIVVASATGIVNGMRVEGPGFADEKIGDTLVTNVSGTTITISRVTTGSMTAADVFFVSGESAMIPMGQLEASAPAVGAWKMPIVAVGQDNYAQHVQVSVPGSVGSSIRMHVRADNLGYGAQIQVDGKISVQINSCAWQPLVNTAVTPIDEISKWYGQSSAVAGTGVFRPVGGAVQMLDLTIPITNGCLTTGTNTIGFKFNGTDGVTSGATIIDFNFFESSNVLLTQAVVLSNVATWTTSGAHGWSTGDWVYIRDAPGPRGRLNGNYQITVTDSTHFQTATCGDATVSMITCTAPNGTYVVPTSYYTTGSCSPQSNCMYATPPAMYASRELIPFSQFTQENPATYAAPASGNATNGKTYWDTATLVLPNSPYFNYASNSTVHCGSCHFKDGSDLKYFAYSNHRIEQRTIFHGGTWQNALDVAAYIRGISITVPAIARPWVPPLQPFPGLDAAGVDALLAGGGLDAYTSYDHDLPEFWYPGGSFASWAVTAIPALHELPYSFLFLPWNKWLPAIHPSDYFPNFASSVYGQCADAAYAAVTPGDLTSFFNFSCGGGNHYMIDIAQSFLNWQDTVNIMKFNPALLDRAGIVRPSPYILALYSSGNWGQVKVIEITKLFGFESSLGAEYTSIFGASANGYYTTGYIGSTMLFDASPHLNGLPTDHGLFNDTYEAWAYASNWQYLATAVADCGNRQENGAGPIDTNYLQAFVADAARVRAASIQVNVNARYMGACGIEYPLNVIVWGVNAGNSILTAAYQQNAVFDSLADRTVYLTGMAQTWTNTLNSKPPSYWLNAFGSQPATCCTSQELFDAGFAGALNRIGASLAFALPIMRETGVDNTTLTNLANALQTIYPLVGGNRNFITQDRDATCGTWTGAPNAGGNPVQDYIRCNNTFP